MATRGKSKQKSSSTNDVTQRFDAALAHHREGRLDQATAIYQQILAVNPKHSDSLHLSGMAAYSSGDLDRGIALIEEAVKLQPKADIYIGNLGNVYRAKGNQDKALECYRRAIALNPANPLPQCNLGNVLADQGFLNEAVAQYELALTLRPDFYEALFNLAINQRALTRLDEAEATLRRAISLYPNNPEAHYTLAQVLLLTGRLADGWTEYDWRWKLAEYSWLRDIHGEFSQPRWAGEALAGKTILVYAEQGMGDSIHFVRYLPKLVERGARVVFAVHPRARRLIGQMDGVTLVTLDTVPLPAFDVHSPLLSLPQYLGARSVDGIYAPTAYLQPEPARVARWRDRLAALPGLKIGIAWQGNPNAKIDKGRSPPLAAFAPLAQIPGVTLISLQQMDGLDQLQRLPAGMRVETLGNTVDMDGAFVDTAAIMANLDLLVLSDSAIAHVAGATGCPVWIPLKRIPDWRFLLDREDCPWYPTMRLFRQSVDGDWADVFSRIAQAVRPLAEAKVSLCGTAPVVASVPIAPIVPSASDSTNAPPPTASGIPFVPQSWGEMIDKITILEIKTEKIADAAKLANIRRELDELVAVREQHFPQHAGLAQSAAKLKKVNESLWWIEDEIRDCERAKDFGPKFIELARAVYVTNDQRADVKREINELLGSTLKEEKSYAAYTDNQADASAALIANAKKQAGEASTITPFKRDFTALNDVLDDAARHVVLRIREDIHSQVSREMIERLQREGVLRSGMRMLDVAAANGLVLSTAGKIGVMGVGIAPRIEANVAQTQGLDVREGDANFLDFAMASFDMLWSRHALQRSPLPMQTLAEYSRVLKAGGHAYVEVPAPDTAAQHQLDAGNWSVLGQSAWAEQFKRAGFETVWAIELNYPLGEGKDSLWGFLLRKPFKTPAKRKPLADGEVVHGFGPLFGNIGYQVHARNFYTALNRLSPVNLIPARPNVTGKSFGADIDDMFARQRQVRAGEKVIMITSADDFSRFPGAYKIGFPVFECTRFPQKWIEGIGQVDELWVPSKWALDVVRDNGITDKPIHIVPEGFDPGVFHPGLKTQSLWDGVFRFICVGKWEVRKGQAELLQAYVQAFRGRTDVELTLICHNPFIKGFSVAQEIEKLNLGSMPPLRIITHFPSDAELAQLYADADCFVLPTKAEGWGLPIMEAMACGTPVIVPNHSALSEFVSSETAYVLPTKGTTPVHDPLFFPNRGEAGEWAYIDVNDIAAQLLAVSGDRSAAMQRGLLAAQMMRERWSWQHAANKAMLALRSE